MKKSSFESENCFWNIGLEVQCFIFRFLSAKEAHHFAVTEKRIIEANDFKLLQLHHHLENTIKLIRNYSLSREAFLRECTLLEGTYQALDSIVDFQNADLVRALTRLVMKLTLLNSRLIAHMQWAEHSGDVSWAQNALESARKLNLHAIKWKDKIHESLLSLASNN